MTQQHRRFHCRIDGCGDSFVVDGHNRREHEAKEHTRCICGWVGVWYAQHVAQRQRRGRQVEHRAVEQRWLVIRQARSTSV